MGVVRGDNSLFFATGIDNSGLKRGTLDAVGLVQNMANKISSINPFAALAVGAIAAFTTISAQAYQMSRNFEHAMKEVETISDATQKNFEGISSAVFALSKITPDAPEKLAKAYYQIVSAGYDGAQGLKLLEVASKSAVAGVTDTITAADGITTVLNAFNLDVEQSTNVADIMFKTVQLGKCVTGDTRVLLNDGRYVEIKHLQDGGEIISYDGRSFIPMNSKWIYQGKKPIVFLKTRLGREIKTTWNHPYLTKNGWVKVKDLNVGERIAVPTQLPFFGEKKVDKTIAEFLGLWIAEGSLRSSSPRITTAIYEYKIKDFANYFNTVYRNVEKREGRCPVYSFKSKKSGKGRNEIQNLLYSLGYDLQSKNKFIPEEVFSWNRESLAIFLKWLFNGDGWLNDKRKQGRSGFSLGVCFNNKKLIEDVSHLLLRFGIVGKIRKKKGVQAWIWETNRYNEIERFINFIGIDRPASSEVLNHKPQKTIKYDTSVEYDPIVEITEVGFEDVYDLTVPYLHNFVANDIVAHNTTFSELASNLATVAPLAAAVGVDFTEVAGAVATLTKQGVPTAQAMTQIRAAIVGANKALGDGWSEALTLQEAFQILFEEANGSQDELQKMVGTIEGVSAILGVAGKNAEGAAEDLEAMANAAGSSEDAFNRMASSNINQIEILRNRIIATTKSIGDAALDMANDFAGSLNSLFEEGSKLTKELDEQATKINQLYQEYTTLNKEEDRRLEIIEEIRKINPSIISDLENQTKAYDKLGESVRKFNSFLLNRKIVEEKFGTKIGDTELLIEDTQKVTKKITANLYEEYADFLKNLPKLSESYQKELNKILDSDGDRIEKIRKIRALLIDRNASQNGRVDIPFGDVKKLDDYNSSLKLFSGLLEKTQQKAKDFEKALTDNNESASFVIQEIKGITNLKELYDRFGDFRTKSIVDAVKAQEQQIKQQQAVQDEVKKINDITREEYTKNKSILSNYLKSESDAIREAAEKRKKYFEFTVDGGDGDEDKSFSSYLKQREEAYSEYTLALENKDEELAEKLRQQYKIQEEDYTAFLRRLYDETEDTDRKIKLLDALKGTTVTRDVVEKVSEIDPQPIVLDVKIDTTSINAIKARLEQLNRDFENAQSDSEKAIIGNKILAEEEKLAQAEKYRTQEKELYEDLQRSISDLNNKELKNYIDKWRKKLKEAKAGSAEAAEAEGNIQAAQEQIGQNIADTFLDVSGALSEASSLFRKFGDEDLAQLLDQLSGVAKGAGTLAQGIADNNPWQMIQGGLQILNSAISVEIVSDTAKFEAVIKDLEKAIEKLDYVISKSVGADKIDNRIEAIEDLKELEEQAEKARQAELKARKEVKLLGITIGKKGSGSGTDPAKLEELEAKIEEATRKAEELRDQLNELYTGTTESTIVDSIISGLKEGKKSVEDFADNFKDLMQDAMLQAFQIKYLEKEIEKFYDAFAEAGSDGNYTAAEINSLRNLYETLITGAQADLDAINQVLEQTGIGALGATDTTENQSGLAGAIRRELTEETGSELTGLFRNQLEYIKQQLDVSTQNLSNSNLIVDLTQTIANNTAETVAELKLMKAELKIISENTEQTF